MKKLILLLISILTTVMATAQGFTVTGKVMESNGTTPVELANVQLLSLPDSLMVSGVLSKQNTGAFSLKATKAGRYVLKVSYIGYTPQYKNLTITSGKTTYPVGNITMTDDGYMLKDMVVTGRAPKVEMKADTMVYNSSAYRIPEGSTLEELVRQLPGAQVDDNGNITINGKSVKKILLNGKEFFGSDISTAMKNLPTNIVEKIKAYDKKSDLAQATGIDDGEDETVIDLGVKKENMNSWFGNLDASYGSEKRYSEKIMLNQFNDKQKFMILGNMNNVGDQGFPGGGGGFRGGQNNGLNARKMLMSNYSLQTGKVDAVFSARYNYTSADILSKTKSHNFTTDNYSYSMGQQFNTSHNFAIDGRVEWKPDSLTQIFVRPNFSWGKSNNRSKNYSVTSGNDWGSTQDDPYSLLTQYQIDTESGQQHWTNNSDIDLVNVNNKNTESRSTSLSAGVDGMYNRRLNNKGRNFTLRGGYSYSKTNSKSYSYNNTIYGTNEDGTINTSDLIRRYISTPVKSHTYSAGTMWSEPVFTKGLFLQLRYRFSYTYNKSDRSTYNIEDPDGNLWGMNGFTFPGNFWGNQDSYLDATQSTYATYKYFNHNASMQLRYVQKKFNLNVGVSFQPQHTEFTYIKNVINVDTTRNILNVSPTLDFRYKFSNTSQLRIRYRGTPSQPSMTDLLNVVDNSDPLNISAGNPGLKPSFTNNLNVFYNTYNPKLQQGIIGVVNFSSTSNDFGTRQITDKATGTTVSRPENINGNWSVRGFFGFNTAVGPKKRFNINSFANASYQNAVAYTGTGTITNAGSITNIADINKIFQSATDQQKATTKTTTIGERLGLSYRTDLWEVGVNGSLTYNHSTNTVMKQGNLETWTYSFGPRLTLNLPWGTSLSTDISDNARRGYTSSSMNTTEWIWNLQLSQSFLRTKNLILSVQFYDLLKQQSNISRSTTPYANTDTWYNSINSYMMVHLIYRFNNAKGKKGQQGQNFGPGGGRLMGPPPGGFGRGPRF